MPATARPGRARPGTGLLNLLVAGSAVSSIGTGMSAFALAVHVWGVEHSAGAVAAVQMCALAPVVLLAPVAGVLADRFDRRTMMVVGDGGSVLGLAWLVIALGRGNASLAVCCAALVLSSCFAALTEPALRASVSDLVEPEQYVRASGMLQLASSGKFLVSPLLAGMVLPAFGLRAVLAMDMATVVVTVCCSLAVRRALNARADAGAARRATDGPAAGETGAAGDEPWGRAFLRGWTEVTGSPAARFIVAGMTFLTFAVGVVQTCLKPMLLPHVSTWLMGGIETVAATGVVVGAVVASAVGLRPWPLLRLGVTVGAVALAAMALRPWAVLVGGSGVLFFAALALCNAGADAIIRLSTSEEAQARVWGVVGLVTQSGYLVAYAVAGPLADRVMEPAMAEGGAWAHGLGAVLGTGTGRGCAVMVALMAVVFVGVRVFLSGKRVTGRIESDAR